MFLTPTKATGSAAPAVNGAGSIISPELGALIYDGNAGAVALGKGGSARLRSGPIGPQSMAALQRRMALQVAQAVVNISK